ncbi:S8 family serine peptidase [Flavitalea sp. BT771]|uniref:S8 family serine peptidase n=1 Tax=Flavitalea sp. BT771 TaxID=3063329 RepID=UPI0026E2D47F|nr:S8 family serine peptidase [Flavitalea sp. BT771]MDO6431871.1 S8 family serine peptidase [Flavitalea sp. BT771]MDV6220780.1 S8 family serine peptidase [Flavitalea sp. BT771]
MKKNLRRASTCLMLIFLLAMISCGPGRKLKDTRPIRWNGQGRDVSEPIFRKNELLVLYKKPPTDAQTNLIRQTIQAQGIQITSVRKCNACDSYVELWSGQDIHTVIHGDGVSGGSGRGGTKGVGDDSLATYSLNYFNKGPVDSTAALRDSMNMPNRSAGKGAVSGAGKDTIIVAVLDTGVDTANFINGKYLWRNKDERNNGSDADRNCYVNDVAGWNFIANNNNIHDDNHSLHGTLVSNYIIQEFVNSPRNFVQIMSLKTHDASGYGDLFSSICAIHYAIKKGANIINASWGFYYYQDPHPYLDSLITKILPQRGILFITAAGNKIDSEDKLAWQIYHDSLHIDLSPFELRDLAIHNFYPGCLSTGNNNVITATTTNGLIVSPTQNHSSVYADLGVKADSVTPDHMKFLEPFTYPAQYISGSSFATAVASGKIGAYLPKAMYLPGINKLQVFTKLAQIGGRGGIPQIIFTSPLLITGGLIRGGKYIIPR